MWATLLALEREGTVDVGLVSAPALGRRWWALRGGGAYAGGERCSVSRVARLEDAMVSATSVHGMPPGMLLTFVPLEPYADASPVHCVSEPVRGGGADLSR